MKWKQTGGARVGRNSLLSINYTWPLAHITLSSENIELKYIFGRISLKRTDVLRVELYRGLFSKGIRLRHHVTGTPHLIVFWPSDFAELQRHLCELGYGLQGDAKFN
jgi:hypothetical protein